MSEILDNYHLLQSRITTSQKEAPLAAKQIDLIAVSKFQPLAKIQELLEAGHRIFGENRVQEAETKWVSLRNSYPDIQLHLIGSLQSNKVKDALQLFDVIQTIDRESLIDAIMKQPLQEARCKRFFIQVNIGEESQKAGVIPSELPALLDYAKAKNLTIEGLMCVPPHDKPPAPYFALLKKLAGEHAIPQLSMGMSGDFETAIRFSANYVRIGTALFGERGE